MRNGTRNPLSLIPGFAHDSVRQENKAQILTRIITYRSFFDEKENYDKVFQNVLNNDAAKIDQFRIHIRLRYIVAITQR